MKSPLGIFVKTLLAILLGWIGVALLFGAVRAEPVQLVPQNFTGWFGLTLCIGVATVRLLINFSIEQRHG